MFGRGTYRVGAQLAPGTYRYAGGSGAQYCGWLRLRRAHGGSASIIGYTIGHGEALTVSAKPTDRYIEIEGSCQFTRAA